MSVRVFTTAEIDPLVGAALEAGLVVDSAEATRLGRLLLRQHAEAFIWYVQSAGPEAFLRLRTDAESYVFRAGPLLDGPALDDLVDLYIYNAEEDPAWSRSEACRMISALRERRAGQAVD